eukprot:scaffold6503_cov115-Isochrysis_galbana.AAC.3
MGEPLLRHEVVRLDGRVQVVLMDANRDPHQHVLRSLHHLAFHPEKVGLLERLEAKEVVLEVAVIDEERIEPLLVLHDDLVHFVRDKRRSLAVARVDIRVQRVHGGGERLVRHLVQVGDGDARSQTRIIGVLRRQVGGRLSGEIVKVSSRHAVIYALDHLDGDDGRVDVLWVKAIAELLDARSNLVEHHRLTAAIALYNMHVGLCMQNGKTRTMRLGGR